MHQPLPEIPDELKSKDFKSFVRVQSTGVGNRRVRGYASHIERQPASRCPRSGRAQTLGMEARA